VADAFEVPLTFLMDAQNHALHSRDWKGVTRKYYAMPFGERYIWGVTAGILRNLYERIYGGGSGRCSGLGLGMGGPGDVCAAGVNPAARKGKIGGGFVVILRVAILALGPGSRGGCLPLAQCAAPRARANVLVLDLRPMIRPVLTEIALFLAPFLVYA